MDQFELIRTASRVPLLARLLAVAHQPLLDDLRDGIHDRGPRLFLPTILGFFPTQRFANRRSMVSRLSSNLTDALSIHTRRRSDKLKLIHPNHLQPPFCLSFTNHNRLKQRSDWGGSLSLDHSPPKRVTFTLSKSGVVASLEWPPWRIDCRRGGVRGLREVPDDR